MNTRNVKAIGIGTAALLLAGCGAVGGTTEASPTKHPAAATRLPKATPKSALNTRPEGREVTEYASLPELTDASIAVVRARVTGEHPGATRTLADVRSTPRISTLHIEEVLAGTLDDTEVQLLSATSEEVIDLDTGAARPPVVTTWTYGHDLKVGDEVIVPLIPMESLSGVYSMTSMTGYFLLTPDGTGIEHLPTTSDYIAEAQDLTPSRLAELFRNIIPGQITQR